MTKRIVQTDNAPAAIGPYSQAVAAGGFLFCSGQIPLDPATGEMVTDDPGAATELVLKNLLAVLAAGGAGPEDVVKTTVYLADMKHFPLVNEVYARVFGDHRPARTTVQVASLPDKGLRVEIDAIAYRP